MNKDKLRQELEDFFDTRSFGSANGRSHLIYCIDKILKDAVFCTDDTARQTYMSFNFQPITVEDAKDKLIEDLATFEQIGNHWMSTELIERAKKLSKK